MKAVASRKLDGTLELFGEGDPDRITPVKPSKRVPLFKQGELALLVRGALRKSAKPLTLCQLVANVIGRGGHGEEAIPAMRHRVRASLGYTSARRSAPS
jgi:hypothetical protein